MPAITLLQRLVVTLSVTVSLMSQSMELIQPLQDLRLDEQIKIMCTDGTVSFDRHIVCLSANIAEKIQQLKENNSWNGEISLDAISVSELEKIKQVLELFHNEAPSVYYAPGTTLDEIKQEKMLRALKKDIQDNKDFIVIRWLERLKPLVTMQNNQERDNLLQALKIFGLPLIEAITDAIREEAVHGIPFFMRVFNDQRKQIVRDLHNDPLLTALKITILQSPFVTSLINNTNLNEHTAWIQAWIQSAAWSPDGNHIIITSEDNTAKIWQKHNGIWICIATLTGHTDLVNSATWSPDGNHIVTTSEDNTAKIWQYQNGTWICIDTLKGHTDQVVSAKWSPDGTHIVTASGDKTAKIWQCQNGTWICIATLKGHTRYVTSAAWSPDGTHIITKSGDKTAKIWQYQNGTWICIATGSDSATWSPDGTHIVATQYNDHNAKIWEIQNGTWICIATLTGHTGLVNSATWSPDGKHIVTASWDNTAKIWEIQNGTWTCIITLTGHTYGVRSATRSPDGNHIITALWNGIAKIWNIGSFLKMSNYLHDNLTYSELMLLKNVAAAKNNGRKYPLNSTTHTVFDQLGGDDKQIKNALQNAIKPYVIMHANKKIAASKTLTTLSWCSVM